MVLCHFSNDVITDLLGVNSRREFAPWIYEFILLFANDKNYELNIIAPHSAVWSYRRVVFSESVMFHFIPDYKIRGLGELNNRINRYVNYSLHRWRICKICDTINPSLIHLFGAENPYYGLAALDLLNKYPVVVTIQGVVNHVREKGVMIDYRKRVEVKIIERVHHFGVRDKDMIEFIQAHNSKAILHHHEIPIKHVKSDIIPEGTYDLIFFARVVKSKGIEDFIEIVKLLSNERPSIKAAVIGGGDKIYVDYIIEKIKDLGISENIRWVGVLDTIDQVHRHVVGSRLVVLPTYADTIPGTILESFQLGVPVIAYAVGGIPSLNLSRESIALIEKGDINKLALRSMELLNDDVKRNTLGKNAKETFTERWGSNKLLEQFVGMYSSVLGDNRATS